MVSIAIKGRSLMIATTKRINDIIEAVPASVERLCFRAVSHEAVSCRSCSYICPAVRVACCGILTSINIDNLVCAIIYDAAIVPCIVIQPACCAVLVVYTAARIAGEPQPAVITSYIEIEEL